MLVSHSYFLLFALLALSATLVVARPQNVAAPTITNCPQFPGQSVPFCPPQHQVDSAIRQCRIRYEDKAGSLICIHNHKVDFDDTYLFKCLGNGKVIPEDDCPSQKKCETDGISTDDGDNCRSMCVETCGCISHNQFFGHTPMPKTCHKLTVDEIKEEEAIEDAISDVESSS